MKLQAVYTVPELAELAGVTRQRMHRMLDRAQVPKAPGRPSTVKLADLREKDPGLVKSLLAKAQLERAA